MPHKISSIFLLFMDDKTTENNFILTITKLKYAGNETLSRQRKFYFHRPEESIGNT